MTTHAACEHPNTKADRARCRRDRAGSIDRHPAGKANPEAKPRTKLKSVQRKKITEPINTALPHAFDTDMERPELCYVCRLTERARVHEEHKAKQNGGVSYFKVVRPEKAEADPCIRSTPGCSASHDDADSECAPY